jgi:hypothetical protein
MSLFSQKKRNKKIPCKFFVEKSLTLIFLEKKFLNVEIIERVWKKIFNIKKIFFLKK